MEKTMRHFLLIMIITGTLFTYGCFNDDLFKSDTDVEAETEATIEAEDEEEAEEAEGEEDSEDAEEEEAEEVKAEETDAAPAVIVETEAEAEAETVVETAPIVEEPAAQEEITPPAEEEVAPADEPVSIYQDGTFSSSGNYFSPAGPESISVTLTLDNDVVTGLTVTPHATHEKSIMFQGVVRDNAPALIVGKKLEDIGAFSKISTSSLTPNALNQAIASIKVSAKN